MRGLIASLVGVVLSCSVATAQYAGGVNVDFNATAGPGAGQPTALFAGAGGQGGYWNPVNAPFTNFVPRAVRNLSNSADAVMLTFTGGLSTATFGANNVQTSGDTELLLDDMLDVSNAGNFKEFVVGPFAPGLYRVIVYAWDPSSPANTTDVQVGTLSDALGASVTVGGAMAPANTLAAGVTHADVTVALGTAERIRVRCTTASGFGNINGFQIIPVSGVTRLYVDPFRPGAESGDGLSWATALLELQTALAIAATTGSVNEIWLTRGGHRPDRVMYSANDPAATFTLRSNLAIHGGFSGTEASLGDRVTGDGGGGTTLVGGLTARHIFTVTGATGVLIDRLSIIEGANSLSAGGCAAYLNGSTVTMTDVRIADNQNTGGFGGALSVLAGSSLTIDRGDAYGNRAGAGSLAYVDASSSLTLRRMSVFGCTATASSAGLIDSRGALTLENCLIANNEQPLWVIEASIGTSFSMVNCTVANNRATWGPYVGLTVRDNAVIRNSIIWGNTAPGPDATPFYCVLRVTPPVSSTTISDSTFQSWDGSLNGPAFANNGLDPRFAVPVTAGVPPAEGFIAPSMYALRSRSPARDSGWNEPALGFAADINGNPRIVDDPLMPNTGYAGGVVDRGCTEMQLASERCPGDIGQAGGLPGPDGLRDNNDFIAFVNYFFFLDPLADVGQSGGLPGSDGSFDNNDFIAFIDLFFAECP